jgi:proteic killer suppression protein
LAVVKRAADLIERHLTGSETCQVFDKCHVTEYTGARMIKSFADRLTQELFVTARSRRFPPDVTKRAARKLDYINLATQLDDLRVPPGNLLHALEGDRKGQYSISINDQWRICFRFIDGDAYDVEVCDYH